MKKVFFFLLLSVSFLFSSINIQSASKSELMCIKGIGEKKASAILEYRKSHKLKSIDDLMEIKGFGKGIVRNIKNGIKSAKCKNRKGKKTVKRINKKKVETTTKTIKRENGKKVEKKEVKDIEKKQIKKIDKVSPKKE